MHLAAAALDDRGRAGPDQPGDGAVTGRALQDQQPVAVRARGRRAEPGFPDPFGGSVGASVHGGASVLGPARLVNISCGARVSSSLQESTVCAHPSRGTSIA